MSKHTSPTDIKDHQPSGSRVTLDFAIRFEDLTFGDFSVQDSTRSTGASMSSAITVIDGAAAAFSYTGV